MSHTATVMNAIKAAQADVSAEPRSFIQKGNWRVPIEVPDAEPPEWYAEYLADVERLRSEPPPDGRTNLQRAQDQWESLKYRIRAEEFGRLPAVRRHEVWR